MYHGVWFPLGGGWLIGLLVFAGFIVLIVAGLAWLLRRDAPRYGGAPVPPPPTARPDAALQILRERFARGEIDEAQYVAASRVLGAEEPSRGPTSVHRGGPPAS